MILEQTIEYLNSKKDFETLIIDRVVFGLRLTAVQLSDGSCGIASTIDDANPYPCKKARDFGDFSPSKYSGQKVSDLFNTQKTSGLIKTLKIAVLNAISSNLSKKSEYKIVEDKDPIDLIDLDAGKRITLVGGFKSYLELLVTKNSKLRVLELNEGALSEKHKKYFIPAEKYSEVIPKSDVVIITGLTLVNNTIDGLLDVVKPNTQVIVTGPSSNIVPEILFNNKVNIIGATRITDVEMLFKCVAEASAGYHLFKYCAKKICILNEQI
ncbi:MAG TPA: DUF364 domain-containing protein [Bacteroidales bacterium]|nr:DUF364 domain-containing protein [Bacteroidales bacterium]